MTVILILVIYLVGFIAAYPLLKYTGYWEDHPFEFRKPYDWKLRNRVNALLVAIGSWIVFVFWIIFVMMNVADRIQYSDKLDKPAKW